MIRRRIENHKTYRVCVRASIAAAACVVSEQNDNDTRSRRDK